MPLDMTKAQKAIRTAATMERMPGSEYLTEYGHLLKDAVEELNASNQKIADAERNASRALEEADRARKELQELKASAGRPFELALATLKEIASGAKGPKGRAVEALKELLPNPPTAQVASPITQDRIAVE